VEQQQLVGAAAAVVNNNLASQVHSTSLTKNIFFVDLLH
jgi:hypothetical protein